MSGHFTFLRQFLSSPTRVGAITPSSRGLVAAMVDSFDWNQVTNVVEYGPGTGVFTEAILARKRPDSGFIAIERSADLVQVTRDRCPGATVCHGSVTDVSQICRQNGIAEINAIVCGLPWAAFSESLQNEIMDSMFVMLPPGGHFATFAYLQGVPLPAGRRFAQRLRESFSEVKRSPIVWKNLPPAFVYRCVR